MSDMSYMDPPIDVVANSPRLEMIIARLRASGMRPHCANEDVLQPSTVPLLVDLETVNSTVLTRLLRLEVAKRPRIVITLGNGNIPVTPLFNIQSEQEISVIRNRLASHKRRALRDEEIQLRAHSAEELGETIPTMLDAPDPDILYLGDGSPFFLALQSALKESDVNLTAALSYATACDYLEKNKFSAVLIDLSPSSNHGIRLLERANEDSRISGLPVYACIRDEGALAPRARAAIGNATDIITPGETPYDTAARITLTAHSRASSRPIEPQIKLASKMSDLATGLFSKKFFDVHLPRQMRAAEKRETPLTLLTLRLKSNDEDVAARNALPDLAKIVRERLRETDCAARLDSTTIAISMPETNYASAVRAAERLVKELGGDELGTEGSPLPFGGTLGWRAVERRNYHTAEKLISSATHGPFAKVRSA